MNRPPTPQERAAKLLEHIRHHSETLLDLGHDVLALPEACEAILEAAADGKPTDAETLARALETAEGLDTQLTWAWLKATGEMFRDYQAFEAKLAAGRAARLARARKAKKQHATAKKAIVGA